MEVFAFMYNSCIYESASSPVSLHLSKAGAWRAMRVFMQEMAANERSFAIQYGGKQMMRYKTLEHQSFCVQPFDLLP